MVAAGGSLRTLVALYAIALVAGGFGLRGIRRRGALGPAPPPAGVEPPARGAGLEAGLWAIAALCALYALFAHRVDASDAFAVNLAVAAVDRPELPLLAVDTQVSLHGQLLLGALTWTVLVLAARPLTVERRAQVAVVICAATVAEVTGSIVWGVYTYRLHNLPTFVPPAHGLVFIAGLSLSQAFQRRTGLLVVTAGLGAATWGALGLTVLPRTDAAGALGVPLLLAFLWRSRARAAYAGVFLVVAGLELYGTAIGTWRWAPALPGLGIPDGNPPSGVASGYVWFDVMALLLAPRLLGLLPRLRPLRTRLLPGTSQV